MKIPDRINKPYILVSIALFAISLTQKAYCTTTSCSDSIMVFLLGWFSMISFGPGICWVANPLLFLSWYYHRDRLVRSMFLSVGAFLMSLSFLLFDSIIDNEGGQAHAIISYKLGYWSWVASTFVVLISNFYFRLKENTKRFKEYQENNRGTTYEH